MFAAPRAIRRPTARSSAGTRRSRTAFCSRTITYLMRLVRGESLGDKDAEGLCWTSARLLYVHAPLLVGVAILAIYFYMLAPPFLESAHAAAAALASLSEVLADHISFWESQTRYCVAANISPFPAKENPDRPEACDDQDMTLFNGL